MLKECSPHVAAALRAMEDIPTEPIHTQMLDAAALRAMEDVPTEPIHEQMLDASAMFMRTPLLACNAL